MMSNTYHYSLYIILLIYYYLLLSCGSGVDRCSSLLLSATNFRNLASNEWIEQLDFWTPSLQKWIDKILHNFKGFDASV